jgi:cysteine-rich repeat protein
MAEDPPEEEPLPDGPYCGNGSTDDGEECDDGNDVNGDGCDNDCTWSCELDEDCVDPEMCNGEETCDTVQHLCEPGVQLANGYICSVSPRSLCLGGVCSISRCGDDFVDTGGGEFCDPPLAGICTDTCDKVCAGDGDCTEMHATEPSCVTSTRASAAARAWRERPTSCAGLLRAYATRRRSATA